MAVTVKLQKPVVFIGAADVICGKAIDFFARASKAPIILADSDENAIRQRTSSLAAGRAEIRQVDIFAPSELRGLVQGAALVVLGAQPYYRTSRPVLAACLDSQVPYLDFSDDVQSTQEALDLCIQAKKQGIPCYINCGASPGMTNLMAADAAREIDSVDTIDVCWYVTDRSGENGKEVLEHLMHIAAGPCPTWAHGKPALHENWVETAWAPVEHDDCGVLLHETIHPEPVTLPRTFPNAQRVRCLGALHPAPLNGIARGLAAAVQRGDISMETAIEFLWDMKKPKTSSSNANDRGWQGVLSAIMTPLRKGNATLKELYELAAHCAGSLVPWRYAIGGLADQVRSGECSIINVTRFMVDSARGNPNLTYHGGTMVRVIGTRPDGQPAVVIRRGLSTEHGDAPQSMATDIGACAATFVLMALEVEPLKQVGIFCPEEWTDLQAFHRMAARVSSA